MNKLRLGSILLLATATGCDVFDESLLPGGGREPCKTGEPGCVPPRPPEGTSAFEDNQEMVFAMRDQTFNQQGTGPSDPNPPWALLGLNLDGFETTGSDQVQGCKPPNFGDPFEIDGYNGIDNGFGHRLYAEFIKTSLPTLDNDVCCFAGRGRGTTLLRIQHWNGQPNDAKITLSILYSRDGTSEETATYDPTVEHGYLVDGVPAPRPSWVPGQDIWAVSPHSFLGNIDTPRHVDENAYIAENVFVMKVDPTRPIDLYLGSTASAGVSFQDGTLYGRMTDDYTFVSGAAAGRMGESDLLEATAALGLCADFALGQVQAVLDRYSDVLLPAENDPAKTCNALSFGFPVHAVRAKRIEVAEGDALCYARPACSGDPGQACQESDLGSDATESPCGNDMMGTTCSIPAWTDPFSGEGTPPN